MEPSTPPARRVPPAQGSGVSDGLGPTRHAALGRQPPDVPLSRKDPDLVFRTRGRACAEPTPTPFFPKRGTLSGCLSGPRRPPHSTRRWNVHRPTRVQRPGRGVAWVRGPGVGRKEGSRGKRLGTRDPGRKAAGSGAGPSPWLRLRGGPEDAHSAPAGGRDSEDPSSGPPDPAPATNVESPVPVPAVGRATSAGGGSWTPGCGGPWRPGALTQPRTVARGHWTTRQTRVRRGVSEGRRRGARSRLFPCYTFGPPGNRLGPTPRVRPPWSGAVQGAEPLGPGPSAGPAGVARDAHDARGGRQPPQQRRRGDGRGPRFPAEADRGVSQGTLGPEVSSSGPLLARRAHPGASRTVDQKIRR